MRRFFRPGRRAICVLLPVILMFAVWAGSASAAAPAAGTVSAATPTTSFNSTFAVGNFIGDCSPVGSNALCDYYQLTVATSGNVQVCTRFDQDLLGMNDIDVFVFDAAGNQVAAGTTMANPECVTFAATAGQTYTIALSPNFVTGIVNATTTITLFPASGGNANGGGSTTPSANGQMMTGGGKTNDGGQFALPIFQDGTKGKIKFSLGAACNFRADAHDAQFLVSMTPNGNGGDAEVDGQGFNNNKAVQFVAHIQDNGEPGSSGSAGGPDVFTIRAQDSSGNVVCNGGGPLVSGNTQYHPTGA